MKKIKYIFFLLLLFGVTPIFSQNKKLYTPPPHVENAPPTSNFSWLNSCFGDTTCFINQTILGQTYTWTVVSDTSFGPFGATLPDTLFKSRHGTDTNICFYFKTPGTYTVSLTAYDNHYNTISKVITIDTITKAIFSFIPCENKFVNTSLCATSFHWDFGDGTNSTNALPKHQYADTGSYMVTMIAYNGNKSDTARKQIHISVESYGSGFFTHTVSHDTVFFHATYTDPSQVIYNWGFGVPGGYGSSQDTMWVYKDSTATYYVTLVITNGCGHVYGYDSVFISQQPPPVPNFSYLKTCLGDTTCFINQTIGGITYTWTVNDTNTASSPLFTSSNSAACFRFPAVGSYSVTLTTNNHFYTVSTTKLVTIGTIPVAGFSFIPCSNNFVNSSGCATSFYWDFGDGTHSTQTLPNHLYADTGYYQVTLSAYNTGDSSTLTQQIHVTATSSADASFTTSIANDTLRVHATYTGVPTPTYNWTFGDGSHATGRDTVHIYYDTTAFYHVKLTVTNLCGVANKIDTIQTIYYNNKPPAGLDFTHSTVAIAPNIVTNGYLDAFYNSYNDNNYLVQIYNALGQKMFEEYFAFQLGINEFKISTTGFSSGVYVLVLQAGNSYIRQKFYLINKP
ncbi:MAG TPA: PKD domain-containing protein [Bacteroidia bacterium]|jgi:PKD repeat protein|nr:PKD domain-containing protein [Bacteroidia bacterium]